jgi:hypothetical protein
MNRYLCVVYPLLVLLILGAACAPVQQEPVPAPTTVQPQQGFVVETAVIVEATPVESPLPPTEAPAAVPNPLSVELKPILGKTFHNDQIYQGEGLFEEDLVSTGPDSFAMLVFFGDSGVYAELRPNTRIKLYRVAPGEVELYLEIGSMKTALETSQSVLFRVTAKAGYAEAKSTEWITGVDTGGNMQVSVLDGQVVTQANAGGGAEVNAGQSQLIPVDQPAGAPQQVVFVALDESHGMSACQAIFTPCDFSYYSKLMDAVKQSGFVLDYVKDLDWLKWYQVLIIFHPSSEYSSDDLSKIQSWVMSGGGLFFSGETAFSSYFLEDSANQLLKPLGIAFTSANDQITTVAYPVSDHPVLQDVIQIPIDWTNNLEGGLILAQSDSGLAVLNAAEPGGRVLVHSDATSLSDTWFNDQSKMLMVNAISWLARQR